MIPFAFCTQRVEPCVFQRRLIGFGSAVAKMDGGKGSAFHQLLRELEGRLCGPGGAVTYVRRSPYSPYSPSPASPEGPSTRVDLVALAAATGEPIGVATVDLPGHGHPSLAPLIAAGPRLWGFLATGGQIADRTVLEFVVGQSSD